MKKTLGLFLSTWILLAILAPMALAWEVGYPEPPLELHYEKACDVQAALTKSGSGLACKGVISSMKVKDSVSLTMTLRKKSGSSWSYVDSWSASGTYSVSLSKTTNGLSSGTYKLFVSGTISGGGSSESVSKESKEITI